MSAADVSLVAVVAVLGQVHDPVVVVVTLGPVHYNLLRAPPMPHNNALKIVTSINTHATHHLKVSVGGLDEMKRILEFVEGLEE